MRKGFTLVELSIVLVIVGLLIGGILVAQSMISTAAISRTVSDLSRFDVAASNYKEQFRYLPGDNPREPATDTMNFGGCPSSNVPMNLGDGMIDGGCYIGLHVGADYYGGIRQFWYIVSNRAFPAGVSTSSVSYVTSGPGQNAYSSPVAKGNNTGYYVSCKERASGSPRICDTSEPSNYYAIVSMGMNGGILMPQDAGVVKVADAYAIDIKMDDGVANNGNVTSGSATGNTGVLKTQVAGSSTENCSTGTAYNVSTSSNLCIPVIRLGASSGVLY